MERPATAAPEKASPLLAPSFVLLEGGTAPLTFPSLTASCSVSHIFFFFPSSAPLPSLYLRVTQKSVLCTFSSYVFHLFTHFTPLPSSPHLMPSLLALRCPCRFSFFSASSFAAKCPSNSSVLLQSSFTLSKVSLTPFASFDRKFYDQMQHFCCSSALLSTWQRQCRRP